MEDEYRFARAGYEAYAANTGWKTFDGRAMPKWDDLPPRIKDAWQAGAKQIVKEGIVAALRVLANELESEPI